MSRDAVSVRAVAVSGLLLSAWLLPTPAPAQPPAPAEERFRAANELARTGDYPKAIAGYGALAVEGRESASLYWNWAQAASARGAQGEALWALLRARELDASDRAVGREVERLRAALNLDPAEIAPEPLAAAGRLAARFRLGPLSALLLALSVVARLAALLLRRGRLASRAAGWLVGLGLLAALAPLAGGFARPTAAVVRRGAPLFDAASPGAEAIGSLREGEVVPVLAETGEWLRVEDNAGARGWALGRDVRRLDKPPRSLE